VSPEGRESGLHIWIGLGFLGGAAVMNGEIAAGRLLAPHLGTSTTTWALLIGTVLTSLAAGSLLGGRLSGSGQPERWIVRLMVASSILFAALPRTVPWLLSTSLDRFRSGGAVALGVTAAITAIAIALPIGSLGALPPLLLHAAGRSELTQNTKNTPGSLGRLAGRLNAAGTAGSLAGTFAAGLWLLPWIGTRATFDVAAILLSAGAAAFGYRTGARRETFAAVATSILTAALAVLPPSSPWARRGRLVWSGESRHNHIAVIERSGERQLCVNDGFAVQSFVRLDGKPPVRDVWAYYALAPTFSKAASPNNLLLLGLGGGTAADLYRRLYPNAGVVGVELDAAIVEAGRKWLGVRLDGVDVVIDDARMFVAAEAALAPGRYDVVILDAFQFPYVPFQLATAEFFASVRSCLAPGGVLMVNAGRYGEGRDVVHAIARTLAAVFPHVGQADPPTRSNTILVASDHAPSEARGVQGLDVPAETKALLRDLAARHAPMKPAAWPEGTPLLTDDLAPVERLTDRIIWRAL
jgi:spermidine synthase